ncbi:hypothetical protein [Dysgonomonas capnocytophagoides]|uniref:hypothetical protein n=1 Tax=Dysgonomonas capnocytophagoides TaxID=45254 RepID=UPI00291E1257|nr:hypothetical protein DCPSUM001_19040 [Dysgonomonas capnocytophagoides]
MNPIFLFISIMFILVSCISKTDKVDTLKENNSTDSVLVTVNKEQNEIIPTISPNFTLFSSVFDTLSQKEKIEFINRNQAKINSVASSSFGRYRQIKDIDSIFQVLVSCRIDSVKYHELVPFNIFVLKEIADNKNSDGYVGEFITDMYYSFFRMYPGYFYQYLNYIDSKSEYKDLKKEILYKIVYGFDFNDINTDSINNIFNEHRAGLEKNKTQINSVQRDIIKYQKNK